MTSSEASGPMLWSLLGAGGWKIAKIDHGPLTKMASMPIYGKNL